MALITIVRRFLVLTALMFWTGGFTFYAAVVVPVGAEVLGSHREQGYITQSVTNYLNLSGAVALTLFAMDTWFARDSFRWRRRVRWLTWLGMGLTLAALVVLHPRLETLLARESTAFPVSDFRPLHRVYLWTSTLQWGFAVLYTLLTISAWRAEDRASVASAN
jgi:hypothetical protein